MVFNIIGALAGGVVGGVASGGNPMGIVAGVGAGSSFGGMIDTAFSDTPNIPGVTGEQKSLLASSMSDVERADQMQGVSSQQVQRMYQASNVGKEQQIQFLNAMQQQPMTAFEREGIAKSLLQQISRMQIGVEERIADYDSQSEAQRFQMQMAAKQNAAAQASEVQRIQREKEIMQMKLEQAKWDRVGQMAQGAVKSVALYYDIKNTQAENASTGGSRTVEGAGIADRNARIAETPRVTAQEFIADASIMSTNQQQGDIPYSPEIVTPLGLDNIFDTSWLKPK